MFWLNRKTHLACRLSCRVETENILEAVMYTVNMIISRRQCKMLLRQTVDDLSWLFLAADFVRWVHSDERSCWTSRSWWQRNRHSDGGRKDESFCRQTDYQGRIMVSFTFLHSLPLSVKQLLPINASPVHWRCARHQWRGLASIANTCPRHV